MEKFRQYPELAKKLVATGDAELIYGNTCGDTYWGVFEGEGENNLGKVLMKVRDRLVAEGVANREPSFTEQDLRSGPYGPEARPVLFYPGFSHGEAFEGLCQSLDIVETVEYFRLGPVLGTHVILSEAPDENVSVILQHTTYLRYGLAQFLIVKMLKHMNGGYVVE